LGCEESERLTRAKVAVVLAYTMAAVPLLSTLIQWSAALHSTIEVGHALQYGESYSLSEPARAHANLAGFTMLVVLPLLLAAPLAIAVAHYLTRRGLKPLLLWAFGIGSWWLSVWLFPVFEGFVTWYLD